MYLKNIEVHGFKSFANKINFQFHDGITGIVGPNGSGKSNVADAVRWVLGEQRAKQLRGSNMQDVIFAGTKLRKPMSYASVAITIDNSDHQLPVSYEEITVMRRLYRSGESEYMINGTQCRLRDIYEMFYDTGIGKEGYSIIGQGQIDKVLSGKPEERRELFDEAAGIVKFKRRKETAQKKLEGEHQNLTRANDVLAEIEKRLPPLEKQSETARIYLKKRDELKACDVNSFLLELARIKKEIQEVSGQLAIANEQTEKAKEEYAGARRDYEEIEEQVTAAEKALSEMRAVHADCTVKKEQLEGRLTLLKEQLRTAKAGDEAAAQRFTQLEEQTAAKQSERDAQLAEQKAQIGQLAALEETYGKQQAAMSSLSEQIEQTQTQMEHDREAIVSLLNGSASLQAGQQKFDTMLEQVSAQRTQLGQRMDALQESEQAHRDAIGHIEEDLSRLENQMQDAAKKETDSEAQLEEAKARMAAKNEALVQKRQLYLQKHSRLESLTNMAERYEGYSNSIRSVMEQKGKTAGIVGVVADIIKTEKKYETAIETALGGTIQNVITEDEQTAKRMITYLKENRLGRATFLPLTSIRPQESRMPKEVFGKAGVLGLASSLASADARFASVKEYLLGRFLVVDTMDHALALAREYKQTLRIVTLEGELFNPGGSITGGAFKNKSNLLGRRREISELQKEVRALAKQTEELEREIAETKEARNKLRVALEQIREQQQNLNLKQNTARLQLSQEQRAHSDAVAELEKLNREKESAALRLSAIQTQQKKITHDLELSADRQKTLEASVTDGQQLLETQKEQLSALSQEAVNGQVARSKAEEKLTFIARNLARIDEEIAQLAAEKETLRKDTAQTREEMKNREETITAVAEAIERAKTQIAEKESAISDLEGQREQLVENNRGFFAKREELSERLSLLDKESYRLTSRQERLNEEREKQINYMWEEYELTFSSAEKLKDESMSDLRALRKRSKELRGEIRELGPVNVNAIDEYKETFERYEFMRTQRDDLLEAEKELLGVIDELDKGMKKQFRERFVQVQVEFDKAFQELFGGGKGSLELVDEEDLLDTGINIIAQPPGKKLQNMMQLSGGEKALTAIALLFAIQNLKPSPFCLLDEIEAALDDSNVGRFAGYLHKLTKHTQFIMITHRRGTMAAADRLYGITMQEKGVSTLVSVNLIRDQLDA